MPDEDKPDGQDSALQPFTDAIGDAQLAEKLFGKKNEITWLKNTRWEYSCMTLTRDGKMRWKDEDKYDWDTTTFVGSYTLAGTEAHFIVTGNGDTTAHFDANKDTASSHFNKKVTSSFNSDRFTGPEFTITYN